MNKAISIATIVCGLINAANLVGCAMKSSTEAAEATPTSSSSALTRAPTPTPICISSEDGPCGGFTQHPCQCGSGLICVPNRIPDIPGTCEPNRCCPAGWDMFACKEENGTSGLNCHNPQLACASSLVCDEGCDFQVTGRCPVCDPIRCPQGEVFDQTLCKCVPAGCTTAADCSGPLPQLCQICADGSSACAHWACVAGQCQVATCP
jgi:hypothetical protein